MADFQTAFKKVLALEGTGFINNPVDRGGPTKFGVTLATLSEYRGRSATGDDVAQLTQDEAQAIYQHLYWDKLNLTQVVSQKVANVLFAQAVNRGAVTIVKRIQGVLAICFGASLKQDGVMGPTTVNNLNAIEEGPFLLEFCWGELQSYIHIVTQDSTQVAFLSGWVARCKSILLEVV